MSAANESGSLGPKGRTLQWLAAGEALELDSAATRSVGDERKEVSP